MALVWVLLYSMSAFGVPVQVCLWACVRIAFSKACGVSVAGGSVALPGFRKRKGLGRLWKCLFPERPSK